MLTRHTLGIALLIATALPILQTPVSAQFYPRPDANYCARIPFEPEEDWSRRCYEEDAERRRREMVQQLENTDRQRTILEKQAPLPASRNRLLGRWQTATSRPASGDPFAGIAAMLSGCGVLLGDAIVEFEATRWAIHDEDGRNDMGAISYRGGANGAVFGLPAKGSIFNLLPFEFETPDRIRMTGVVCTLVRTNATVPAGRAAGAAVPAGRGAAPPARAGAAAAPAAAAFEEALAKKWRGHFGYDCPNGQDVAVESCTSEAENANCVIVRVDQPPTNGALVTFNETRAALIKRIASCQMKPLRVVDGKLGFPP